MKKIQSISCVLMLSLVSCLYPGEDWGFEVSMNARLGEKTCERIQLTTTYQITKGSVSIEEAGVCYSVVQSEPNAENATLLTATINASDFTTVVTGLKANTTYYFRPYVRVGKSYAYGEIQSAKTDATTSYTPAISASNASGIGVTKVTLTASLNMASDAYPIEQAGFCYSQSVGKPTLSHDHVEVEPVDCVLRHRLGSLRPDQHYYVRAYATNAMGTVYSQTIEFSTKCPILFGNPQIVTQTATGATVSITVQTPYAAEGYSLTESGFCYAPDRSLPDVSTNKTVAVLSDGQQSSTLSLGSNISLFVRAYAKCSDGNYYYSSSCKLGDKRFIAKGVSFAMVAVNGGRFTMGATDEQLRSGADPNVFELPTAYVEALNAPNVFGRSRSGEGIPKSLTSMLSSAEQVVPASNTPVMLSLRAARENEKPTHEVTLSPYYIGKYEVTQQLYQAVMGSNPSGYNNNPLNPVEGLSWYDCIVFIDKLNALTGASFVLPTEAQWEYAARGGSVSEGFKYAGSDRCDSVAWTKSNADNTPHPVGSRQPNALGIYDMSGNISEKCYDWYSSNYYDQSATTDPAGPTLSPSSDTLRVHRGGDYYNTIDWARVASRSYGNADSAYLNHGFRLAMREGQIRPTVAKLGMGEMQPSNSSTHPVKVAFKIEVTNQGSGRVSEKGICISTRSDFDLSNAPHYYLNTANDSYEYTLFLVDGTTFYARAYAISEAGLSYGEQIMFTTPIVTVSDVDGNKYRYVTIGTQTWMAENLKTTKYNDGSSIPNVTNNDSWADLSTGAYCWYDNDASNKSTYGALYNWYAVNTGKLCPKGWHVPTDAEWTTLTDCVGGSSTAGDKLKEAGSTHWKYDAEYTPKATNAYGFTALPGGYRSNDFGHFDSIGYYGYWWSSTECSTYGVYYRSMNYDGSYVSRSNDGKEYGFSVRCLRN